MIDRPIRAVLSDMYGTLLYEDGGLDYSYSQMALNAGLNVEQFTIAREATFRDSLTGVLADAVQRAHAILRYMGIEDTDERARRVAQAEIETRIPAVHLYPDTVPTLNTLRKGGYRLGLISDCTYLWRGILQRVGLEPMFDVVTLSNEAGTTKPDPRMYLSTIESLHVEPEECLFVGDGGSDELEGAHALGIYAVLVDQQYGVHRRTDGSYYDACIHHLGELLDLLPSQVAHS